MRFVTFAGPSSIATPGIHLGTMGSGTILPLESLAPEFKSILEVVEQGNGIVATLEKRYEKLRAEKKIEPLLIPESSVKLLSPITRPISMRDGYAFRQHVEAARRNRGLPMIEEFDLFPIFYFTNHLAVMGSGDLVVQKQAREKLDFELEIAIVTGKAGKNFTPAQADEAIFGYTIMNDWSARHLQMEEMKLNLGPAKGKDFATGLGPYLVSADELKPYTIPGKNGVRLNLRMQAWVNGIQVSDGNVKDMTWTFGQIMERVSYGVQVYPGEVIGSGTVGTGCFLELNGSKITDNQWLKPGDTMVLEIEGLGRLENKIVAAEPADL